MKCKWFFTLINVCAIVLIAASVFVLLTVVLTPAGQVPRVMGFSILRVLTGSMEPEIPEDAMLLVRQTAPETLKEGDIISFFSPDPMLDGALNTHRIVRVESVNGKLHFTTKGDANLAEDQRTVSEDGVVGKVVFVSTRIGKLVRLVSNPLVFGLAILLPLAIMLVSSLVSALRSAILLARKEEEEAVRQALEDLKTLKNRSVSHEDGTGK